MTTEHLGPALLAAENGASTLSFEQLQQALRLHRRELSHLLKMNEQQFQAFRRNFTFGNLKEVTRAEAERLLRSMIATNLTLQQQHPDYKASVL